MNPTNIKENHVIAYNNGIYWEQAKVIKVHYDDIHPYYTILLLSSNKEKQTISNKIKYFNYNKYTRNYKVDNGK